LPFDHEKPKVLAGIAAAMNEKRCEGHDQNEKENCMMCRIAGVLAVLAFVVSSNAAQAITYEQCQVFYAKRQNPVECGRRAWAYQECKNTCMLNWRGPGWQPHGIPDQGIRECQNKCRAQTGWRNETERVR
jgi:hypothetical protein